MEFLPRTMCAWYYNIPEEIDKMEGGWTSGWAELGVLYLAGHLAPEHVHDVSTHMEADF